MTYNLDETSLKLIDKFYKINLETDSLTSVPNKFYDYVLIAHVIEHLNNGEDVIVELSKKVNINGIIYIEYPRNESANFPSMKGTLNFYDDPTHKEFYDNETLNKILEEYGFEIVDYGTKRDFLRIVGIPFMALKSLFVRGYIGAHVFWDLFGFANFILAERKGE